MVDDVSGWLLAVPVLAAVATVRWPLPGLLVYLWFDFMRPHDYFAELGALRPMLGIGVGLLIAAARDLEREDVAATVRSFLPIGVLWLTVVPGSVLAHPVGLGDLLEPVKLGLVSWLIVRVLATRAAIDLALLVIAGSLTVLALDAVWQGYSRDLHLSFDVADVVEGPGGAGHGVFGDNNDLARALVFAVPLWTAFAVSAATPWARGTAFAVTIAVVAGVLFTGSRGGFVALICTFVFLFFSYMKPLKAALATIVTLLLLVVVVMPRSLVDRVSVIARPSSAATARSRVDIWRHGLTKAVERPLFGHGLGTFAVPHAKGPDHPPRTAHNIYVELFYEAGAIGLAAYLALLAATVWRLRRVLGENDRDRWLRPRVVAMEAGLVSFLVAGLTLGNAFQSIPFAIVGLSFALESVTNHSRHLSPSSRSRTPISAA